MEITPEIAEKIESLKNKYDLIGQDLNSYLDGLLYQNPLHYWDYIQVETLLSLQRPKTDFPDEIIFIVYHQITELFFLLTLHEMDQIANNGKIITPAGQDRGWKEDLDPQFFLDRLKRINQYFEGLTKTFGIMTNGMERDQFSKFRMALLPASGFQAANYRRIEICSTDLRQLVHIDQREKLWNASLHEQLDKVYWKWGATELESGQKTLTLKLFEEKYMDGFLELAEEYKEKNIWQKFIQLPEAERSNPELLKEMRQLDVNVNVNWPLAHYRTAVAYLAKDDSDVPATGGTNWQKYLPPRFQKRVFYPELWSEQELAEWGKSWVTEVLASADSTKS